VLAAISTEKPSHKDFPPVIQPYEEITVKGMTEMIEHRKMEPVFYIAMILLFKGISGGWV